MTEPLLLRALRGEPTERPPIWLMRQAGRYLPEYRALRAQHDFLTVCRTPELATEVALQPLRRFPLDGAILFADILLVLEPMGAPFVFTKGRGPKLAAPLTDAAALRALKVVDPRESLGYVADAVTMIARAVAPLPLLGFAGAPFTLASYLLEGGRSRNFVQLKRCMYAEPALFAELLDKLATVVVSYLRMQIEAGAQAIQLFDTWAGILAPAEHRRFVLPVLQRVFAELADTGVPRIVFMRGCGSHLPALRECGADVVSLDWTVDMAHAVAALPGLPVQGNLDPLALTGTHEGIRRRAAAICAAGDAAPGHIFNLGHGLMPEIPVPGVEVLVDAVRTHRRPGA